MNLTDDDHKTIENLKLAIEAIESDKPRSILFSFDNVESTFSTINIQECGLANVTMNILRTIEHVIEKDDALITTAIKGNIISMIALITCLNEIEYEDSQKH